MEKYEKQGPTAGCTLNAPTAAAASLARAVVVPASAPEGVTRKTQVCTADAEAVLDRTIMRNGNTVVARCDVVVVPKGCQSTSWEHQTSQMAPSLHKSALALLQAAET